MNYLPIDKDVFALTTAIIEAYGDEAMRQAAIFANVYELAGDIEGRNVLDVYPPFGIA